MRECKRRERERERERERGRDRKRERKREDERERERERGDAAREKESEDLVLGRCVRHQHAAVAVQVLDVHPHHLNLVYGSRLRIRLRAGFKVLVLGV